MISNLNFNSSYNSYSYLKSSAGGGSVEAIKREDLKFDLSYDLTERKAASLYADNLIKRVTSSNFLNDSEKNKLISQIATFDENDQLSDGSIYALVSMNISFTERNNATLNIFSEEMKIKDAYDQYDRVRKLFGEEKVNVEISGKIILEQFSQEAFGKSYEELSVELDLDVTKDDESAEYDLLYNSKGIIMHR